MRLLTWMMAITLAGCVMNKLEARIDALVGKDIHVAIARLGYPNETRTVVGDTVYTWVTDIRAPYPCRLALIAGPSGIIKTRSLEGTELGCKRYNDALDE